MNPGNIEVTDTSKWIMLYEYAAEREEKMTHLLNAYTDINFFGRLWDSKVPEKDEAFYRLFSLKESDNDAILDQIKLYQKFYEDIVDFVHEVICKKPVDSTNLRRKFARLKKKLSEIYQMAKREIFETSSSAIYKLHRSFIKEYKTLYYILKDFENVSFLRNFD